MKTPFLTRLAPVTPPFPARRRAFSLVEVTLALGIVTFGLVGVVGVLPTALASGRQSFDQNRAAAIANTIFASLRSQPFSKVGYLDEQFSTTDNYTVAAQLNVPLLNLNSSTQSSVQVTDQSKVSSNMVQFYATFLDIAAGTANSTDTTANTSGPGTPRQLAFTTARPNTKTTAGASYLVTLFFNNAPDGMAIQPPADNAASNPPAQANRIDLLVSPANEANQPAQNAPTRRPLDQYRFVSTVANRVN